MPDRLFSDADLAALYDAMCPRDSGPTSTSICR